VSTLISREATVSGRYSGMGSSEFDQQFGKTWKALDDVKQTLAGHVQQGNITPIDAIRGFAALTANLLGYEEFVPRGLSPMAFSQQ
jgi:hypothetical protein